ncbi:anthranilate phosphoribosyltransferase, partial [Candidatus Micrarchaeota archaeon CG11_big_fil_rev_8_21_14_0_20_47_5]
MLEEINQKLKRGAELSAGEATDAMRLIMGGRCSEDEIVEFLSALSAKGETAREIAAFARVMRENCNGMELEFETIDTCGTGGDEIKTFNISTACAFVLAGGGLKVAKHGNRAFTSKAGSADVLEALGVKVNLEKEKTAECVRRIGIGFLFAPLFHPAMKNVASARKRIGKRTVFNLLGPLTNPFGARRQVLGVYEEKLVEKMGAVLNELGCVHGFVVHGVKGLDEASVIGETVFCEVKNGKTEMGKFSPEEFGITKSYAKEEILGGDAKENAQIIKNI